MGGGELALVSVRMDLDMSASLVRRVCALTFSVVFIDTFDTLVSGVRRTDVWGRDGRRRRVIRATLVGEIDVSFTLAAGTTGRPGRSSLRRSTGGGVLLFAETLRRREEGAYADWSCLNRSARESDVCARD